jgi:hypothetical protein
VWVLSVRVHACCCKVCLFAHVCVAVCALSESLGAAQCLDARPRFKRHAPFAEEKIRKRGICCWLTIQQLAQNLYAICVCWCRPGMSALLASFQAQIELHTHTHTLMHTRASRLVCTQVHSAFSGVYEISGD